MIKVGVGPHIKSLEFWKTLNLPVEWVEGEVRDLLKSGVVGIMVNPDDSEALLPLFHEMPRMVIEGRAFDYIEVTVGRPLPVSVLMKSGAELLTRGGRYLNLAQRAYITGSGAWARLFTLIAVEKGYTHISLVLEENQNADQHLERLRKFCFGVTIDMIPSSELNLQPNNGSLLVNTFSPDQAVELIEDLSYLNYLSPQGLVIETVEFAGKHDLLEEAHHSKLAVISASDVQGFIEYKALAQLPGLSPGDLQTYLQQRSAFFGAKS